VYLISRISVEPYWLLLPEVQPLRSQTFRFSFSGYLVRFYAKVKVRGHPVTCLCKYRWKVEIEPRGRFQQTWNGVTIPGFHPRTILSAAGRYTDWATLGSLYKLEMWSSPYNVPWKHRGESGDIAVPIHDLLATGGGGGVIVDATCRPLYPREREPIPILHEAGCNSGPVWTSTESLALTVLEPRTLHLLARRYNDDTNTSLSI
jgi:hypothetical protein